VQAVQRVVRAKVADHERRLAPTQHLCAQQPGRTELGALRFSALCGRCTDAGAATYVQLGQDAAPRLVVAAHGNHLDRHGRAGRAVHRPADHAANAAADHLAQRDVAFAQAPGAGYAEKEGR